MLATVVLLLTGWSPFPAQETGQDPIESAEAFQEPVAEAPPVEQPRPIPTTLPERSLATLEVVERSRESKRNEMREARDELTSSTDDEERGELFERLRVMQAELERMNSDYESIVSGIDVVAFDLAPAERFDLQEELSTLIQPIVEELKSATEAPRQIERLRSQLDYYEDREELAREALQNVENLLAGLEADDPRNLRPGLEQSREGWERRIEQIGAQRTVARFQLENRLSQRTSVLESTQSALGDFFRTRGLNVVLAVLTFLTISMGLGALYRRLNHWFVRHSGDERPFYARVVDVLFFLFVGSIALLATLLVLYARSDWVLLGLLLMFLLGIAWASKAAFSLFLEQIRLLLNLGSVRERELVVIDGVSYRVSKLSFYTLLSNSELAGGVRRLPIRDLIDMRSRTCSKDELWFPCRRGDWIRLADGQRGLVRHQTPDAVQLELLGGSFATYRTADFLAQAPENLSKGFRISVTFGIDYDHQAICTTEVPTKLTARVRAALEERFGADALVGLKVEFQTAGASSLDYAILADLDGSLAKDYDAVPRLIQRTCVEVCNDEGWVIPFTQVTLHQAESS